MTLVPTPQISLNHNFSNIFKILIFGRVSGEDTYKGGKKSPPPSCGILKGGEISPTLLSKFEGGKKSPPRENSHPGSLVGLEKGVPNGKFFEMVSNIPNIHLGIYKNYQNFHLLIFDLPPLGEIGLKDEEESGQ